MLILAPSQSPTSRNPRSIGSQFDVRGVDAPFPYQWRAGRKLRSGKGLAALFLTLTITLRAAVSGAEKATQPNLSSSPPADSAEYIRCPADLKQANASTTNAAIACSESLMDPYRASDIFGRRISNTYLLVEVKIRNLSSEYHPTRYLCALPLCISSGDRLRQLIKPTAPAESGCHANPMANPMSDELTST